MIGSQILSPRSLGTVQKNLKLDRWRNAAQEKHKAKNGSREGWVGNLKGGGGMSELMFLYMI